MSLSRRHLGGREEPDLTRERALPKWSGARCLVTGARGFVGSHLVDRLLAAGATVFALSRHEPSRRGSTADSTGEMAGLRSVIADLRDASGTALAVRASRPTHVFHVAGVSGPNSNWDALYEGNVIATLHLLDALRAEELLPRIVVAGSSAVYGNGGSRAIIEELPFRPVSLYGVTKAAQELLAIREEEAFGTRIVRARLFNLLGPRQAAVMLVSDVSRQIALAELDGSGTVEVGDLGTERDYLDVRDAASALMLLGDPAVAPGPYNLASGVARSTGACVKALTEMARRPIQICEVDSRRRAVEVLRQVADPSKLLNAVEWRPEVPFTASLRDTLDDWRARVAKGSGA